MVMKREVLGGRVARNGGERESSAAVLLERDRRLRERERGLVVEDEGGIFTFFLLAFAAKNLCKPLQNFFFFFVFLLCVAKFC